MLGTPFTLSRILTLTDLMLASRHALQLSKVSHRGIYEWLAGCACSFLALGLAGSSLPLPQFHLVCTGLGLALVAWEIALGVYWPAVCALLWVLLFRGGGNVSAAGGASPIDGGEDVSKAKRM
jgi:hypothetical protein